MMSCPGWQFVGMYVLRSIRVQLSPHMIKGPTIRFLGGLWFFVKKKIVQQILENERFALLLVGKNSLFMK